MTAETIMREACEEMCGDCDLCPPGKCDSVVLRRLIKVIREEAEGARQAYSADPTRAMQTVCCGHDERVSLPDGDA